MILFRENIIGIYKITSPSNRIYIGQSTNIKYRFSKYNGLSCKEQVRLYRSFLKYGVINHKFEILEECLMSELNDKERYYQDLFSVLSEGGLNCVLTKSSDRSGSSSKETCKKISDSNKGRKLSKDHLMKMSIANKGKVVSEETRKKISEANKGRIISEITRKKISLFHKGKRLSEETKKKIGIANTNPSEEKREIIRKTHKGKKMSDETRKKMSDSHIGIPGPIHSEETRKKMSMARKGKKCGVDNHFFGKKHTEASKIKSSISAKNRPPMSDETRKKISLAGIGRVMSEYNKIKLMEAHKGHKHSDETRKKMRESSTISKKVLDKATGITYKSLKEASLISNIKYETLSKQLSGVSKNKTTLIYI